MNKKIMNKAKLTTILAIVAVIPSCTTLSNKDYPLVFMDKSTLGAGVELNPSTNTYTTTVGLRARSFALVPVTTRTKDGSIQSLQNNGESMSVYTEFGGKQSFLSNLLGVGKGGDKNEGGIAYQRVFATGAAATVAANKRGAVAAVAAIKDPNKQEAAAQAIAENQASTNTEQDEAQ